MDFSLITDASLIETESNNGKTVFTDKRLEIYRQWFEEQFKMHKLKTLSLSQNGVRIRGMEIIDIKTALEKPDIRQLIDSKINSVKAFIKKYKGEKGTEALAKTRDTLYKLSDSLADLIKVVTKARISAESLLDHCKKIKILDPVRIQKLLEELDKADNDILSQSGRNIAGFLLQDTIRAITGSSAEKTFDTIIEKSYKIYSDLEKSIKLHQKYIDSALKTISLR